MDDMHGNEYFKNWKHSLFRNAMSQRQMQNLNASSYTESMPSDDANFDAASTLIQGRNPEDAWQFITLSLRKNPDSVHAWCNKGVYHLKMNPPQLAEAEEAESKMRQLLEQSEPRKRAIVEKAYWLYEIDRSYESRATALQLFKDTLVNKVGAINAEQHHLYLKVLARRAKIMNRNEAEEILQLLLLQLEILFKTHDPYFQLEVWTFLAEVQLKPECTDMLKSGCLDLSGFRKAAGTDRYDMKFCIAKVLEVKENNPQLSTRSNFYGRIARWYLHLASHEEDYAQRLQFLEDGLKHGQRYSECAESRINLGPAYCAKICFNLWAMKYYKLHTERVQRAYFKIPDDKNVILRIRDLKACEFLVNGHHSISARECDESRPLLEEANKHFAKRNEQARVKEFELQHERVQRLLGYNQR